MSISISGKRQRLAYVHHWVLEAFVGRRPKGKEARHKNGNQRDNRLLNLAWGTKKENAADKFAHGTMILGLKSPCAKLTARQVREVRSSKETLRALAQQFGLSPASVWRMKNNLSYKDVR